MSVIVVTASRLGSTTRIGERIVARLAANGVQAVARDASAVGDLGPYRVVILGSGVYAGHWLPAAKQFAERHAGRLVQRHVWLFSSGPVGDMATRHEAEELTEVGRLRSTLRARGHRTFAGALDRATIADADLGRVERFVAEHFVPEGDYRDWAAIDAWADEIARTIGVDPEVASTTEARVPTLAR
jgi:menaquinone-dependent protoporphyrinogen oxidase